MENKTITLAVTELKDNLSEVARVVEWAELMGYDNPRTFSDIFLRHYGIRPQKIMELVRLESIIRHLRSRRTTRNLLIARRHSIPDEKSLYNFTNYHLGYSPTNIRNMTDSEVRELMRQLWNSLVEEYGLNHFDNNPSEHLNYCIPNSGNGDPQFQVNGSVRRKNGQ